MSCPVILAIQNPCLALSCSVLATKIALWPESGHNFAQSGHKFSYGSWPDKLPLEAYMQTIPFGCVFIDDHLH